MLSYLLALTQVPGPQLCTLTKCTCGHVQALISMLEANAPAKRQGALLLLVRLSHGLSQRTQGRPPRAVTAELLQEASFGELLSRLAALIKVGPVRSAHQALTLSKAGHLSFWTQQTVSTVQHVLSLNSKTHKLGGIGFEAALQQADELPAACCPDSAHQQGTSRMLQWFIPTCDMIAC